MGLKIATPLNAGMLRCSAAWVWKGFANGYFNDYSLVSIQ